MNKKAARSEAVKRRGLLSEEYRRSASRIIAGKLKEETVWQSSGDICLYYGCGSEVQTADLIFESIKSGKKIFLPKVVSLDNMVFISTSSPDDIEKGAYGIPEPRYDAAKLSDEKPDLVIVPCLAMDRKGNRAGHGKGFYDRYLKDIQNVPFICLAFDCQIFECIETDENDVRMDMIVTEKEIIRT